MDNEEDEAAVMEEGAGGGKGKDDDKDKEEQPPPPLASSATGSGGTAETPSVSRSSALAGSDLAEEAMGMEASVGVVAGSAGIRGAGLAQDLANFQALLQVYPKGWMPRDLADLVQRRQSACRGHVL